MRGHVAEMAGWFERLLAVKTSKGKTVPPSLLTEALQLGAAYALSCQTNAGRARELTEALIGHIDALTDTREIAYRLQGAGSLLRAQGEYTWAAGVLEQALPMFRELDDKAGMGAVLGSLGDIARDQGDAARVIELSGESLRLSREVGNSPYLAYALHNLGAAALMQGDLERARALCEEALKLSRQIGWVESGAEMLNTLAAILRDQGDLDEAETLLVKALQDCLAGTTSVDMAPMPLEAIAGLAVARQRCERAAELLGVAHALRERIGTRVWPVNRPAYERDLASVRGVLGAERFVRAWEEGRAMTLEQAMAYAFDETPGRSARAVDAHSG
jgi:tetratricopeptide (TPR) repeat protein